MRKLLFTLAFLALVACEDVSSDQYIARAKDYIADSDYPSATIELQNALKLDSSLGEARWLLGKIYLGTGNILAAEHEFQRAQKLDWTANDVLPALAKTHLAQGKYDEVLALEPQGLNPSAAAELISSQAMAALADEKIDKSYELIALAQSKDPKSVEPVIAKATVLISQDDYEGALKEINAVLKVAPDNEKIWRLKGQALLRLGQLEEARDAFDQSIALSQFVFADLIVRALINLQFEDFEAAQADASEILAISPSNPAANYVQGLLRFRDKDYLGAIGDLTLAEPAAEQFPLILYYLSLAYLIEKDIDLSVMYAGRFVERSPESSTGRKLYAATLIQKGKVKEAQAILRPLLQSNSNDIAALNIMANAYLLDDQAYAGLVLYSRIAQLKPDWTIVPLREEATQLLSSDDDVVDQASDLEPDKNANFPQTEILQILEHLEEKNFPAAIEVARSYQFRDLESLSPYHVLGKVYLVAGEPDNARAAFEKALVRKPGDSFANLNLAQLSLQDDDLGAARQYYQDVLSHDQNHLAALLQLAALEAREKNRGALVKRLKQAIKAHPKALEPRLILARYYIAAGEPARVAPLFAATDVLQSQSPRELEVTGTAQLQLQQYSAALDAFEQLVEMVPDSAKFHYLLAMSASGLGETEKSKAQLMEAVRLDAEHVPALLSLAKIANREGENEQVVKYLATLVKLAPESTDVIRLQALSEQENGNSNEALKLSQRVFDQSPTTQTALELASYQKAAGKKDEARKHMQNWIDKHSGDIAMRIALANHLESGIDVEAAKTLYLDVLEISPNSIAALNNLAWILRIDNPDVALDYILRASDLAPDNPAVLDTLAFIEHLNGDNESAQQNIQRALAGAPDEMSIRYHAAVIDAALGETKNAIGMLEALIADGTADFPERTEAEKLLTKLRSE